MTGIETYDFEQRSDEWYAIRRGIVTASTVGRLITEKTLKVAENPTSRALTSLLVAERITDHTDMTFTSSDMWRGILDEPVARDLYGKWRDTPVAEVGFMVREINGHRLGYSPDGLVGDKGLIEIKSRLQKNQLDTVIAGRVPSEHMAQIQTGLLVSGREWCDFISYCSGMHLYVIRAFPSQIWFDAITAALNAFEEAAADIQARYLQAVVGLPMTERIDHETAGITF